ncbi:Sec-independent protein translocase protein TatB [Phenylobacterium sp.]|uniref:Sec-independent protein translocase protein TatB n=1 Tax=Phenylobacterium sp. TaxID=1871053 RepID=UPI00356353CD
MFPEGRALELLIAAVVALIVVGPKDLPVLLRKLGQFMAKVRSMAAEFRASFDEMARQSELDELRQEVEAMRKGQLLDVETHAPEVNQAFNEISQGLSDVGVELNQPVMKPYAYVQSEPIEVGAAPRARARKAAAKAGAKKKPPAKAMAAKPASKAKPAPAAKAKPVVKSAAKRAPAKAAAPKPRARKASAP